MTFILKSCCVTCCELANINALEIYAFPSAWPLKSTVCRERTGTIVRKTDAAHTAINVWQCTNARHKKPSDVYRPASRRGRCHWLQGEPPTCTRATYWCDRVGIFLLITTISSHLVLLFFLIKSQHWCYLTLIWSQLNPCLNLWQRGPHSNSLSVQPLTPLRLLSWLWVHWSKSLATFWSCDQRIFAADQVNKVIRWKFNHTGFITDVHRPEI